MRTTASVFVLCLVLSIFFLNCPNALECVSDRDCQERLGNEFFCVDRTCKKQSASETPVAEENKPDAAKPDTAVPEPEPIPEPTLPEPEPTPDIQIKPPDIPETPPESPPSEDGVLELHQPCADYDHAAPKNKCKPGLICVRIDSLKAFCFQDCSENSAVCTINTDRTACRTVTWQRENPSKPVRICVQERKENESCDAKQSTYCAPSQATPLVCDNGTCTKGKLCTSTGCSCESRPGSPVECDINKKLVCDPANKTCVTGLQSFEGLPCGLYKGLANICPVEHACVCGTDQNCFGTNNRPSTCRKLCNLNDPLTTCSHRLGFSCKSHPNNVAACVQDNCEAQLQCTHQTYAHECVGAVGKRSCEPFPQTSGDQGFGQYCDNSGTKSCKRPFNCLYIDERTVSGKRIIYGYCSMQCSNTVPEFNNEFCQKLGGATCSLVNNTTRISSCGWSCSGGRTCPTGFTCNARNLCSPPIP